MADVTETPFHQLKLRSLAIIDRSRYTMRNPIAADDEIAARSSSNEQLSKSLVDRSSALDIWVIAGGREVSSDTPESGTKNRD